MEEQVKEFYSEERNNNNNFVDDTSLATLAHILGIFTGFVGPLIMWLILKDRSDFTRDQLTEALNFQISILIYLSVSGLSIMFLVGWLLTPLLALFGLVVAIIAAINASNGVRYRYPLCIRFIK